LKKVFRGVERIFAEAPVRSCKNDVGEHLISQFSNQQPSYALCDALDYKKRVSTDAQAKILIGSFLPFSTVSVNRVTSHRGKTVGHFAVGPP
jgi:hypothetical protein